MSITINRVYTKQGDGGETALVGGRKVRKDAPRIEAYGTVDELNAQIGLARWANHQENGPTEWISELDGWFEAMQNELFCLGSELATLPDDLAPTQPQITAAHTQAWETVIDAQNANLPTLRSFVLPGGGWVTSLLHIARTICRRAERRVVVLVTEEATSPEVIRYLNRLSDLLFVLGRANARARNETEPLWKIPGQ